MRKKRKVFIDAFITAILVSIIWMVLEMVSYGKVQPRIVDDVIWIILWRYIYLAKLRETEEKEPLQGIKRRQG